MTLSISQYDYYYRRADILRREIHSAAADFSAISCLNDGDDRKRRRDAERFDASSQ